MVGGPVRAPHARHGGGLDPRPAELHGRPLHPPHPGPDRADGDRAGRRHHVDGQLGDGDRHDDAGQPRHRSRPRTSTPTSRRRCTRRRSAPDGSFSVTIAAGRRHLCAEHARPPARRAPRRASRARVVFDQPPGHAGLRRRRSRQRRQRPGQLRLSDRRGDSTPAPTTSSTSRSTTPARPVVFQLRTRDLTPTFGSPLGAQLVDVYVHVPGASTTSTAASFPERRYAIAAGGRVEPPDRGAGLRPALRRRRTVDTLGTIGIRGNAISRNITFAVPKAALGTPGRRLGLHGRAHRPGRLQLRSGARLHADAAGLPVRRLRDRRAAIRTARSIRGRCQRPSTC